MHLFLWTAALPADPESLPVLSHCSCLLAAHEAPAVHLCLSPLACQQTPTCLHHCSCRWLQDLATWRSKLVALLQHVGPAAQKALQAPARQLLSSDVLVASFADLPEEVKVLVFKVGGVLWGAVVRGGGISAGRCGGSVCTWEQLTPTCWALPLVGMAGHASPHPHPTKQNIKLRYALNSATYFIRPPTRRSRACGTWATWACPLTACQQRPATHTPGSSWRW
jgi:hypothetical protein